MEEEEETVNADEGDYDAILILIIHSMQNLKKRYGNPDASPMTNWKEVKQSSKRIRLCWLIPMASAIPQVDGKLKIQYFVLLKNTRNRCKVTVESLI